MKAPKKGLYFLNNILHIYGMNDRVKGGNWPKDSRLVAIDHCKNSFYEEHAIYCYWSNCHQHCIVL